MANSGAKQDKGKDTATPKGDPVDRAVAMAKQSLDEWATATKSSFDRALAGTYTAEQLARDMTAAWARAVRDWARLLTAASSLTTFVSTSEGPGDAQPSASPKSTPKPQKPSSGARSSGPEA
jgi:hypothetical protein